MSDTYATRLTKAIVLKDVAKLLAAYAADNKEENYHRMLQRAREVVKELRDIEKEIVRRENSVYG